MRRSLVSCLALTALFALAASGCGSSKPKAVSSTSTSSTTTAATTSASSSSTTATGTFDVVFTGGLQGRWQSGDAGTGVTCSLFSNQLSASLYGSLAGTQYGLGIHQNVFTPGTLTFPAGGTDLQTSSSAQIATSSDARVEWNLRQGVGTGTISLARTGDGPLTIAIDGELADALGGTSVHVKASVQCELQVS